MKSAFQNNKGQFFIAIAVVIIFSLSAIFFYFSTVNYATDATLREKDLGFLISNIRGEFKKVAELTLANVSAYNGSVPVAPDPTGAFEVNLSNFSRFAIQQAFLNGILLNTSYSISEATNTTMNATVKLAFLSESSFIDTTFFAYSKIAVNALNGTLTNQQPTGCTFNVTVKKEYDEPVTNLTAYHFGFLINDTVCSSPTFVEGVIGKYNFTCASSPCTSSKVVANVTDMRRIVSWSTLPNTGLGTGCASTCGQPID